MLKARDLHVTRKRHLERLYSSYNRREFAHPDPVEFLYRYPDPIDREIVGLVASALAYGRVGQIIRSVSAVLDRIGSPARFLGEASRRRLKNTLVNFRHRFTTGEELSAMLWGVKCTIERHGSLRACFSACYRPGDGTVLPALTAFVDELNRASGGSSNYLLPSPEKGSACKRLNLYLRWMVRRDEIDPGGWDEVPPSRLIVPLDTHMHRICSALEFTRKKQANLQTALEITEAFRTISPEDPVRYDFALTRLGIRDDEAAELFMNLIRHNKRVNQICENQCNPRIN